MVLYNARILHVINLRMSCSIPAIKSTNFIRNHINNDNQAPRVPDDTITNKPDNNAKRVNILCLNDSC